MSGASLNPRPDAAVDNGRTNVDELLREYDDLLRRKAARRGPFARLRAMLWRRPLASPGSGQSGGLLARPAQLALEPWERARVAALEQRVIDLDSDVRLRNAELLDLRASILERAWNFGELPMQAAEQIAEIRDIFKSIVAEAQSQTSLATVVIPVFGQLTHTLRCLRSIAATWSSKVNAEIIIVDDASPDDSIHYLLDIPRVNVLRNAENLGFLLSTNRGSSLAQTPYTCFLNNDTEVMPGWLEWLVHALEEDAAIGAVGSKLMYPDGTLQEAGSIIWSDASGWNYGRSDDPAKSEYNFRREVDYCSAASLLIRTDLLRRIGGFDPQYAPAYYEDADLCFEIRARGFGVVYEPHSAVVHYEGVSSGTDLNSGTKRYQEINRPKFAAKWADVLKTHLPASPANVASAMRRERSKAILVVDSYVPMHDREAGSARLFKILQILRDLEYHVIFLPDNFTPIEPYSHDLNRLGVEALYPRPRGPERDEAFSGVLRRVDAVWICRPELCERYIPLVRRESSVPIIYDTIDLHFERERRRAELTGDTESPWKEIKDLELSMARASDLVVTVTERERGVLLENGIDRVAVIPTIHDIEVHETRAFRDRSGIVFIGGYGHTPNVDAAVWLCREIMPAVWEDYPDLAVSLLGNNPPDEVLSLASERVKVTGYIADVAPYFDEARLFVAPLRYGAGMKGKVGHALSYGLPVVATTVAIDGYDLRDGENCFIADDADSFARALVKLYGDEAMWQKFSAAGSETLSELGREAVSIRLQDLLGSLTTHV